MADFKKLMNGKNQAKQARLGGLRLNLQYFADNKDGDPEDTKTAELLGEIKDNSEKLAKALEKQDEEIKKYGTTTDKTVEQIKSLEKNYDALQKDIKEAQDAVNEMAAKLGRPGAGADGEKGISIGEYFVESEAIKQMKQNTGARGSAPVELKSFFNPFNTKDLTSAAGSAGVLVSPQQLPGIVETTADRELRIRDLLRVSTTNSNALEYVRETGFTNNAQIQAAEGDVKGQSNITFDLQSVSVKTIAHWIPASRQIMDDAGQLRSYVDNKLVYGLKVKEENQILYGDGLNGNMQGIMTDAAIQDRGQKPLNSNLNHLDHLRKSFTMVRLAEYPTTGIVLNPVNWEEIELMKGSDGHYIWLTVSTGNTPRVFRVPIVQTTAMAQDEFLAGAFGLGAQLWDREQANVRFSEHHADYFTRNMLAILAEERLALTIERPESFVKGNFTEASV